MVGSTQGENQFFSNLVYAVKNLLKLEGDLYWTHNGDPLVQKLLIKLNINDLIAQKDNLNGCTVAYGGITPYKVVILMFTAILSNTAAPNNRYK